MFYEKEDAMQAMRYRRYGGPEVLRLETVAAPTPGPDEVLVQVHAASLNAADGYLLKGEPALVRLSSGLRGPKRPILGADIAGEVVAVGSQVTQFQPGDPVYGDLSGHGFGGFAEFVCAPERTLALKPATWCPWLIAAFRCTICQRRWSLRYLPGTAHSRHTRWPWL